MDLLGLKISSRVFSKKKKISSRDFQSFRVISFVIILFSILLINFESVFQKFLQNFPSN
jgi:hypothetical protein